jgi:hypothetical protein
LYLYGVFFYHKDTGAQSDSKPATNNYFEPRISPIYTNQVLKLNTFNLKPILTMEEHEDWRVVVTLGLCVGSPLWLTAVMPFAFLFASHRGTGATEGLSPLTYVSGLCVGSPSCTLRVLLLAAGRPAAVGVLQASSITPTALDLDDCLNMDSIRPFQFGGVSGEKSLVLCVLPHCANGSTRLERPTREYRVKPALTASMVRPVVTS